MRRVFSRIESNKLGLLDFPAAPTNKRWEGGDAFLLWSLYNFFGEYIFVSTAIFIVVVVAVIGPQGLNFPRQNRTC
jgi:hypothetical protein